MSKKAHILACAAAFAAAFGIRAAGILSYDYQSDERHWARRSHELIIALHTKPKHATDHLGHPGITPTVFMAAGQVLAGKYNSSRSLNPTDPGYIHKIDASRLANAFVSSFIAPVVYLGALPWLSPGVSLLAALLTAFDPHHIGCSRMAHLDSILTLFSVITVFLYLLSIKRCSYKLRLLAGVFWGLSIAAKPTAAALVISFFLYRGARALASKGVLKGERTLLSWSDFGAVLAGHAVFAALFTRFWRHHSDYRDRLHIRFWPAGRAFELGRFFNSHEYIYPAALALTFLAAVLLYISYRKTKLRWKYHLSAAGFFVSLISLAIYLFPPVLENILRFWAWTAGLAHEQHRGLGKVHAPLPYGYLGLFLSEMTPIGLSGIAAGIVFATLNSLKEGLSEGNLFIWFLLLCPFIWILPLNVAPKQTWRYAVPVVPLLYLFAAWGFGEAARVCMRSKKIFRVKSLAAAVLATGQFYSAFSIYPDYEAYFNSLSGGINGAIRRGVAQPIVGQNAALRFLREQATKRGIRLYVGVVGDLGSMRFTAQKLFHEGSLWLRIDDFDPYAADYLVYFLNFSDSFLAKKWDKTIEKLTPVFSYQSHGLNWVNVYRIPYRKFIKPLIIKAPFLFRHTGKLDYTEKNQIVSYADPSRHTPGSMLFSEQVRLDRGVYTLSFDLRIRTFKDLKFAPDEKVVSIEFGKTCRRVVLYNELDSNNFTSFTSVCAFSSGTLVGPSLHWFGTVPVEALGLKLVRSGEYMEDGNKGSGN